MISPESSRLNAPWTDLSVNERTAAFFEQIATILPANMSQDTPLWYKALMRFMPHIVKDMREMSPDAIAQGMMFLHRVSSRILNPIPGLDTMQEQMQADDLPKAIGE